MISYSDYHKLKELNEETLSYAIGSCTMFDGYRCAVICLGIDNIPDNYAVSLLCATIDYGAQACRNPFDSSVRISLKNNSEICFITYSDLGFYENVKFDEILVYEKDRFTSKQLERLVLKHKNFQQGDENSVLDEFLNSFTTIKM